MITYYFAAAQAEMTLRSSGDWAQLASLAALFLLVCGGFLESFPSCISSCGVFRWGIHS